MNRVGECYLHGQGVNRDDKAAAEWFRKGAELGDAEALLNLGFCYNQGRGVKMDKQEAVRWCRKAVEAGSDEAMYTLGWCYDRGLGVERDEKEALKWYYKAAESFLNLSCDECERRVRAVWWKRLVALVLGAAAGITPVVQLPPVVWRLYPWMGQWTFVSAYVLMFAKERT